MIEITACPVCGCKSLVEVYPATFSGNLAGRGAIFLTGRTKAVHGRIVRCTGCGFLFTPPQFRMEDYARIYQAVHAGAAGSPPQFRFDVLARRVRETESGGRFLDFGCGGGGFLNVMKGFDGIGFEVAPGGLTRAGKIVTGDIMSEDFSRYGLGPASFDFIVTWDVLEHLSEPAQQVLRLRTLLKPGGRLYLTLPDCSSWVACLTGEKWNMFLLEHLWYFSPATLRRFLQRCGFTAEAICSIPYPVDGSIGSGYFSQDCRKIADRLNVRHRQQKRRIVTMDVAIVTGSAGLIGYEAARFFTDQGLRVVGIDNDMRSAFFGAGASTKWNRLRMQETVPSYHHFDADIRDAGAMEAVFSRYAGSIATVLHAAAQPSHDWAAKDPMTDFTVNANGTLVLLEMTRRYAPTAPFMYMSTNKVYGDTPNRLPLVELNTRWECDASHSFAEHGIDESMSIDTTTHSLFGVSKASADLMVQEYGRYFGMPTVCFRGGCLAGPAHSGAPLHGFLSWLVKCAVSGQRYTVLGYKGKQVRDNIHAADLVSALWHFFRNPRVAEVYNIGGGRHSQCSVLEAISICERQTGRPMNWSYSEDNRPGDHIWWISDVRKFQTHYPEWRYGYNLEELIGEIRATLEDRAGSQAS